MAEAILNSKNAVENAMLTAGQKLRTINADDQKILRDNPVTLFDTVFMAPNKQVLSSYRMFAQGAVVDGLHRNQIFPDQTTAYIIHGISIDTMIDFGANKYASIKQLEMFLRQSSLVIARSGVEQVKIPLNELLKYVFDAEETVSGETTSTTLKTRVVRDYYPLEDYRIKVAQGEKFDVTLNCDAGFTTAAVANSTTFVSVPPSATAILDNGVTGHAIRLNLHAVAVMENPFA